MSVETLPFLSAVRRMIRAAGKRVASADEFELAELIELRDEFDRAIEHAIAGQLASGRSWAAIATATGTTRQAAHKRYGKRMPALVPSFADTPSGGHDTPELHDARNLGLKR